MYVNSAFKSTRKTDLVNVKKNIIGILEINNVMFLQKKIEYKLSLST